MKKKLICGLVLSMVATSLVVPTSVQGLIDPKGFDFNLLAVQDATYEVKKIQEIQAESNNTFAVILEGDSKEPVKFNLLNVKLPDEKAKDLYAKEAKERISELLQQAETIEVQLVEETQSVTPQTTTKKTKTKEEKELTTKALVWLDGILLQEVLVTEGFAVIHLDQVELDNQFLKELLDSQTYAYEDKLGVWENDSNQFLAHAQFPELEQDSVTGQYVATDTEVTSPVGLFGMPPVETYLPDSNEAVPAHEATPSNEASSYEATPAPTYTEPTPVYTEPEPAYVEPVPAYTEPEPAPAPVERYYANCSEARAAGAAPVYAGEPGYGPHLDRDGDGIGCEIN